jgi:hypothetical protein
MQQLSALNQSNFLHLINLLLILLKITDGMASGCNPSRDAEIVFSSFHKSSWGVRLVVIQ